jgi:hypothetical protein
MALELLGNSITQASILNYRWTDLVVLLDNVANDNSTLSQREPTAPILHCDGEDTRFLTQSQEHR